MTYSPKIIVFLPREIINNGSDIIYIFGEIEQNDHDNILIFYGLGFTTVKEKGRTNIIGIYKDEQVSSNYTEPNGIILEKNTTRVKRIIHQNEVIHQDNQNDVLLFFYDNSFTSEYFKKEDCYFAKLQEKLLKHSNEPISSKLLLNACQILQSISGTLSKYHLFLLFSSIAISLKSLIDHVNWALLNKDKVKVMNLVFCLVIDVFLGFLCLNFLLSITRTDGFPKFFLLIAEGCVDSLRRALVWLTGTPAGFKLNKELNNLLSKFYLFHTEVWWLFLVHMSPLLGYAFNLFLFLGRFGITFQAAILADILGLVSFHAYCIYAYAARLYCMQVSGLRSLCRLFLGRKWNPLREKVDSCHYSADQLLVGTLMFTILLFLLPTTLIYYVVFTSARLVIVVVSGVLTRVRQYLHALPLYSLVLWFSCASSISTQVLVDLDHEFTTQGVTVMQARRVRGSLMATLRSGVPDCIDKLPSVVPKAILKSLLTGELLYPV